jgi:hypothetical protein
MTSRSAALYGLGGVLLVAWVAAANLPQDRARDAAPPPSPRRVEPDALAIDVRSQAERLRTLMAQAPVPQANPRNLFSFASAAPPPGSTMVHAATVDDTLAAPLPPPLPALILMGVAEDTDADGVHRTAIIGGDGDAIYMVTEGQPVGERYRVRKIGADAVELEDVVTNAYRRLALR